MGPISSGPLCTETRTVVIDPFTRIVPAERILLSEGLRTQLAGLRVKRELSYVRSLLVPATIWPEEVSVTGMATGPLAIPRPLPRSMRMT
jgi:hypothetical protein